MTVPDAAGGGPLPAPPRYRRVGLGLGAVLFAALLVLPPPEGLPLPAWRTAAMAVLMAVWWASEALPVAATALLPLILVPLLGIGGMDDAAAPFANPLIFLFLGGFVLALAMQRWNLHRRIALAVVARSGRRPEGLIAGFMAATAFLSMWVSNTATTMMMLAIAVSVVGVVARTPAAEDMEDAANAARTPARNFATALMLGIAYAASIGGLATLIGTPPNALLAAFVAERTGTEIGFARWMAVGLPVSLLLLPVAWALLVRLVFPCAGAHTPDVAAIAEMRRAMGRPGAAERRVAVVFALAALAWIGRPFLALVPPLDRLSDPTIAVAAALALFLIPSGTVKGQTLMNWDWARRLPWGTLILFGGGLSLANAVAASGLAAWIGAALGGLAAWPSLLLVAAVAGIVLLLTELTSNTATTATFLPVIAALAAGAGLAPLLLLVPAALAASCAFMLPVATPPNAIVHGSGHVTLPQMVRAGLWLNLAGLACVTAAAYWAVIVLLGA